MTTIMRIDPKLRKAAKEYQDYYAKKYNIPPHKINQVMPLTNITRYLGETKIPSPDLLDLKILKWKYSKRK